MPAPIRQHQIVELISFLDVSHSSLMAIFTSYWDESGKFQDQSVVAFCGLCCSAEKLNDFENNWRELLRRNELPWFKASEALKAHRALSPRIPAQTVAERIEVLRPFVACMTEKFELGSATAVNVAAFKRTPEDIKREMSGGDDPFYFSFLTGVLNVINYSMRDDKIAIIVDDDEKTAGRYLNLYRRMKLLKPEYREALASITFADDKVYIPLQAADLLAHLVRMQCDYELGEVEYDYRPLFEYLAEDRGSRFIKWRVAFVGEQKMARIDHGWKAAREIN